MQSEYKSRDRKGWTKLRSTAQLDIAEAAL